MPVKMVLDNVWTRVEGAFDPGVREAINDDLSYRLQDADFAVRAWEAKKRKELSKKYGKAAYTMPLPWKWDGRIHFYDGRFRRFPTGLWPRVKKIMWAKGQLFDKVDTRVRPLQTLKFPQFQGLELYPDQKEAVKEALYRQRGVIEAATGAGKTEIIAQMLYEIKCPALVLIHREPIYKDLIDRLGQRLGVWVGGVGSGTVYQRPITVAMMQSITQTDKKTKKIIVRPKLAEWVKSFPAIFVDEAHHIPSDTMYEILQGCGSGYHRYGFSATPWRPDGKEMYLEAALGPTVVKLTPTHLIDRGRLTRPHVFFIDVPHDPSLDALSYQSQYSKAIVHGQYRNQMICKAVYEFWKRGKTCLVAVTQIQHGELLAQVIKKSYPNIKCAFVQGETESVEKTRLLKQISAHQIDVLFATLVFGEGVNAPGLDCIVNGKGGESKVEVFQLIGRALRKHPGKDRAYFVDFNDKNYYTAGHAQARYQALKGEPGYVVSRVESIEGLSGALDEAENFSPGSISTDVETPV